MATVKEAAEATGGGVGSESRGDGEGGDRGRINKYNVKEGSNATCVVDDIPESSTTFRRRSRKITPIVPIPMADLNEHATTIGYQNVVHVYKGISSKYVDHENQSVMCPSCNALLWKAEVNIPSSSNEEGAFSLCCYNGKVELPDVRQPDETYLELFRGDSAMSKYFLKNVRRFNSMFSFTSIGGKIDHSINRGNAPYTFRLSGENYHFLGSLLPLQGHKPQFSQLYIYDMENEVSNRQGVFGSEVTALIVGDIGDAVDNRDIIVTKKYGSLKCISELHPSYTPLQYPLFHLFGEDGYQVNILHKNVSSSSTAAHKKVTVHGSVIPIFFITITCNPNWPEVKRFLKDTTLKSEDRPDILCRLFKLKLDAMIKLVKDKSLFGRVQAVVYTIEFQKSGLPHAHICIFMHPGSKIHNPQDVDKFISAEIPNKDSDPDLYKLVSDHMIHGPCGDANPKCTCMVNKKCSKIFPKMFNDETAVDSQGFPVYKRKDNGQYVVKSDIMMDKRIVVPYNKTLLKQFQAHINVEWCNQDGSIKYVSACEATWRIFSFDVHYRIPSVLRLAFHLPGEQQVKGNTDVYELLKKTSLIIWDEALMIHKHAFESLYRTLKDVMNGDSGNTSKAVFGGKVVVFGGDFRQIFPVVTNGTRSECVNACINSSYIWSKCKVLKLTKNMRLTVGCRSSDVENIREFADWLLGIGQGNVGGPNDRESVIDIPDDLLILNSVDPMGDLIRFVYPNILDRFNELTYFQAHALLAPLNEVVQEISERMLALFPGEEVEYLSSDSLAEYEDVSEDFDPQLYSPDLLNGLKMSGMPNH
ncbi:uncharacterized protein LOC143530216 [Bidens hawaiensis]|uniref:uncharacterized protein LOC143530216 n=1 Tax=Bidens hawaiensis TaxID=980011 RepID=UPI00404B9935